VDAANMGVCCEYRDEDDQYVCLIQICVIDIWTGAAVMDTG